MAAMVDTINRNRPCHIITIEDPIEYLHTNQQAAVSQREVGTDTESFDRALRSALREDPDVVMVGEMRDLESISFALTIAETGHLVLATMHTNDSAQTIDRIIDVFPAERRPQIQVQLAGTLLAVIYQRLVPKVGRRHGRGLRDHGRRAGRAEPGPGGQDPPAAQRGRHPPGRRHADPRALPRQASSATARSTTRPPSTPASTRRTSPSRTPRPWPPTAEADADGRWDDGAALLGTALPVLAGVEPCAGGWLVAPGNLQGITLAPQPAYVLDSLADVLDYRPSFSVVALHAPVGPDRRTRTSAGPVTSRPEQLLGTGDGAPWCWRRRASCSTPRPSRRPSRSIPASTSSGGGPCPRPPRRSARCSRGASGRSGRSTRSWRSRR